MATDLPISGLPPVVIPTPLDEFGVNQDDVSRKMTRAQVHALVLGENIKLPQGNDPTDAEIQFGDGGQGIYEDLNGLLSFAQGSVKIAGFNTSALGGMFVNNTFTGTGLERVLTVSDAAGFGEYRTTFDASGSVFPTTSNQGDWFNTTIAGTVDGQAFVVGDILIALIDNPSTTIFAANWSLIPNIGSTTLSGLGDVNLTGQANNDLLFRSGGIWVDTAGLLTWNGSVLNITGNVTLSGTVDGRDVSVDGVKLDGITAGATPDQTITLTGNVTGSGTGSFAATIAADSVTMDKIVDIATDTFLGRVTALTGTVEVLTNAQAKTALDLTGTNSGDQTIPISSVFGRTGAVVAVQADYDGFFLTPAEGNATYSLLGHVHAAADVTSGIFVDARIPSLAASKITSGIFAAARIPTHTGNVTGQTALTIAADAVTYSKMQNVVSANRILGSLSAGGIVTELTGANVNTFLPNFSSTLDGLTPLSGGGTTNFLRADGTWAVPSTAAPVSSVFGRTGAILALTGDYAAFYTRPGDAETITGAWKFTNAGGILIESATAALMLNETGATAEEGRWRLRADLDQLVLATGNDAGTIFDTVFSIPRTGNSADSVAFQVPITATSYNGILNTNLVDKTAAETISAIWDFTTNPKIDAAGIDTGTFATARIPNLDTGKITTGTFANARISSSSVTQHQAALTILESQITNANVLARIASAETITAKWTFSGDMVLSGVAPEFIFNETDGAVDNKKWLVTATGEDFLIRTVDDAESLFVTAIKITRTGTVVNNVDVQTALTAISFGAILEANLLDKSAPEVITGEWNIPSVIKGKTASYTLVLSDAGQTIRFTGTTASKVLTIPANGTVAFTAGTLIAIHNDGTVNMTIAITTDTLTWAKDNTTGTRTLAPGASAVIQKVASTSWKIAGSALVS